MALADWCKDCRRGHYFLADGGISNFPCTDASCACWFCGPVRTPVQASARAHVDLGIVHPEDGELFRRVLPDGRAIVVVPLTFDRARIHISSSSTAPVYDDAW